MLNHDNFLIIGTILLCAVLHRSHGENTVLKGLWFAIMIWMAPMLGHTWYWTVCWAVILFGYATLPWQALLSGAIDGLPPSRKDKVWVQWMQEVTYTLNNWVHKLLPIKTFHQKWYNYGIIYGAIRSIPALLGVLMLYGYTGNPTALYGLGFAFMGVVYYISGAICRKYKWTDYSTLNAQTVMGAYLGFLLVVL